MTAWITTVMEVSMRVYVIFAVPVVLGFGTSVTVWIRIVTVMSMRIRIARMVKSVAKGSAWNDAMKGPAVKASHV